jgi:hypothetical protein
MANHVRQTAADRASLRAHPYQGFCVFNFGSSEASSGRNFDQIEGCVTTTDGSTAPAHQAAMIHQSTFPAFCTMPVDDCASSIREQLTF